MGASLSPMVAVAPLPRAADGDDRVRLDGIPWETYVALRDSLDEQGSNVRLTYLEGALEIMSPGGPHEISKKLLGRLIEAYAEERDLDLDGWGSTTYRDKVLARGLEPDECYVLGGPKKVPDLAIEIVFSRPKIDKLAVYRGLGVGEVWVLREGRLTVHVLGPEGYAIRDRSALLPDMDLDLLLSFLLIDESQTRLVKRFRAAIR